MNRLVLVLIFLLTIHSFAVEKIIIKETGSIDFLDKMEAHDYFFKKIRDVAVDNENNFYLLDYHFGTILRVDANTGELLNTISRRGQGPSELHHAKSIRVRNNMVFVADSGFQGIKIFEKNGKLINEFKTRTGAYDFCIDVDKQNKIFVKQRSSEYMPCIAVYNIKGEYLYEFVKFPVESGNRKSLLLNRKFIFKLDNEGNMVVVFILKKKVQKFNHKGGWHPPIFSYFHLQPVLLQWELVEQRPLPPLVFQIFPFPVFLPSEAKQLFSSGKKIPHSFQ